jgi:hypothetical protein
MLFRVPPSSLRDMSEMADKLKGRGYPYNSVAVRISFDMTVSHPKPTFDAIRPLTDDEADAVIEMFHSDSVERVLADNEVVPADEVAAPQTDGVFLQPQPQHHAAPAPVKPQYNPEITLAEVQPVPQRPPAMMNTLHDAPPPPAQVAVVRLAPEPAAPAPGPAPAAAPAAAPNPFAASVVATQPQQAPAPQAPAAAVVEQAPMAPQLAADIGSILAGLDSLK